MGTNVSAALIAMNRTQDSLLLDMQGEAVKSMSGKEGFMMVDYGRLRFIPNMDTFKSLGFAESRIHYFKDSIIEAAPKGPPMPACKYC